MSKLFPELDRELVRHILRNGVRVTGENTTAGEVLQCLRALGLVTIQEHRYVRCAYRDDYDFLDRKVLDCPGRVELDSKVKDYYCPDCGQPIGDIERKTVSVEYEVRLSPDGIEGYLEHVLESLDVVEVVKKTGTTAFEVRLQGGMRLKVVVPDYAEIRHRFAGLFFAEPMLYVIASSINEPVKTVLEERQYIQLADVLSSSASAIQEILRTAAVPIPGRRDLSEVEARFDEMITRQGNRYWQFFEQDFIPALVLHITENPALVQRYLESIKRLSGTVFGEYYVPIGGAGRTDLRPISKLEMMNQLIRGNSIGDAKCHRESTLTYKHIATVNLHLDKDPVANTAVIYVANDNIASTAWDTVMDLRKRDGTWKIIILPKYLLLELITTLEATHLLDM